MRQPLYFRSLKVQVQHYSQVRGVKCRQNKIMQKFSEFIIFRTIVTLHAASLTQNGS